MGLSFTTLMLALALGLAFTGNLHRDVAGHSALALAPVAAGMLLGQGIRRRLAGESFKRWFYVGLAGTEASYELARLGGTVSSSLLVWPAYLLQCSRAPLAPGSQWPAVAVRTGVTVSTPRHL